MIRSPATGAGCATGDLQGVIQVAAPALLSFWWAPPGCPPETRPMLAVSVGRGGA